MELMTTSQPLTMSSRDIAELCEKEHGHVMRDIRAMLIELHGEGGQSKFGSSYTNSQNKEMPEYLLPKRETLILVSGYRLDLRAKIIDRWQELESAKQVDLYTALNDPSVLRATLGNYVEKVLALESRVESMAGEVKAYERIAKAEGSLSITEAAKSLQMRPQDLFRWLQAHGWIYKRHGGASWLGYQAKTNAGYLEHKVETIQRTDGSDKIVEQVRITPKGIAKLALEFGVPALKQSA